MATRKISISYKIIVLTSLMIGIILNIMRTKSITTLLSYYTLQSNLICCIAFICFIVIEVSNLYSKDKWYYLFKGTITIGIFLTALVYRVTLAQSGFEMDSFTNAVANKQLANAFVHTISPIMVISDYFLFDQKGKFKWFYPFLWILMPIGYVVYVYLYSACGGEFFGIGGSRQFAYFFLDYESIGVIGVTKWILIFCAVVICFSYCLIGFDYWRGQKLKEA